MVMLLEPICVGCGLLCHPTAMIFASDKYIL